MDHGSHINFLDRPSFERRALIQKDVRKLYVYGMILTVLNIPLWYNFLSYRIPASASEFVANTVVERPVFTVNESADLVQDQLIDPPIDIPVSIIIPAISLNAAVEQVAVAVDGSMDVPKQPMNTGWYELGPRPGEVGNAVIAGHVNWKNGVDAVFADLHNVKPGDEVRVEDVQGTNIAFVVRESRIYDAMADATDIFYSTDGKAHLNIVTCTGAWDTQAKRYSKRLVVFADKESN